METVLCCVAHPDDEVIGMGGTLVNYSKAGDRLVLLIFSYGEKSDPLVQESILMRNRLEEAKKIGRYIGVKEVIFLGIEDGKIRHLIKDESFLKNIASIFLKYKPDKIFTHAAGDAHISGDHIAVHKIILKVFDRLRYKGSLYTFDVWSPLQILQREKPRLYVDISKSFKKKIKALEMYDSQKASVYPLLPGVHLKARVYGSDIQCKYAEMFYKIR